MALSKGVVKLVLSGDTVVIRGRPVNGPPPERQLSLAFITAPRLARKDEKDEPFAWESREFLRKLLVGKEVSFKVEYSNPGGREYGAVFLGEQNVAHALLEAGLAKLGKSGADEAMVQLEQQAQAAGVGMFTKEEGAAAQTVRGIKYTLEEEPRTFLDRHKGAPVDAIVERVRDGSTLQVLLLPSFQQIVLLLSGIRCPAYRKDVPDQPDVIEPFGAEARFFTETRLLQQDVKVVLEGLNNKNFVGTVLHPNGNIAEALTKEGFAKVVDWSITLVSNGPKALRDAEKVAKQKQLRIWKDYKPKAAADADGRETTFTGKVTRILTGESLVVTTASGAERRLFLASVRQPRAKEANEAPYQPEAKEFLRSRLIGRKVHVTIDYVKPPEEGFEERVCASIKIDEININEALVSKGLATVVRHRQDDENRASNYDQLLLAEDRAQKGKKGMHNTKEVPVVRVSDASENLAKAKTFLNGFKRQGRLPAIVEHVFNGARFKLHLPKENAKLVFVLSGVRVGRIARTADEPSEPFGQEAFALVNEHTLQHDVDVEIENVDKNGGFIGTMYLKNGENVAVMLLEQGLAQLHGPSADQSINANNLYSAEKRAKTERKNIWASYDAEAAKAAEEAAKAAAAAERKEVAIEKLTLVATEVLSGNRFFAQTVGDSAKQLETLMAEFARYHRSAPTAGPFVPRKNDLVSALFSADSQWYRARVVALNPDKSADVFFIDFGNSERVPAAGLRPLPAQFQSLPAQANEYQLAGVGAPPPSSDYEKDAKSALGDFVGNRALIAQVVMRVEKVAHVIVYDDPDVDLSAAAADDADGEDVIAQSINARIIENGLGIVEKRRERFLQPLLNKLTEIQAEAQLRRLNIWEYGDITSDDAREFGLQKR